MFHTIEEALKDLQVGKVIIVCDDENRENEGDFVGLGELVTPHMINFMVKEGRGLVCMPMSAALASKLELKPMVEVNTDNHGTAFTVSIDHIETTTGISAYERTLTIQKILDKDVLTSHFDLHGNIFPIVTKY